MGVKIPPTQRTLKDEVVISGRSFLSKNKCTIRLLPAKRNTGIVFVSKGGTIPADIFSLDSSFSNTSLRNCSFCLTGVEHILAALFGSFIDNVEVEVYDDYLPSGDGSTSIFYNAVKEVGMVEQDANRRYLPITRAFSVQNNGSFVSISPSNTFNITYTIGKPYPKVVHGIYRFTLEEDTFLEVSDARTWAEKSHVTNLWWKGVKGIDRSNCLIIENGLFVDKLRSIDEPIRHKVADCIGDLALLFGMYLKGEVVAFNAGHKLHHELMRGILNDPSICNNR